VVAPYALFARHAVAGQSHAPLVCHLPPGDPWMQNFVRPMVEAAGYRVVDADGEQVDLAILMQSEPVESISARQTIRLRSGLCERPGEDRSIYRYDHAGLLAALRTSDREMRL
jgi:two-component system chemotaxis sensor kinase CheA